MGTCSTSASSWRLASLLALALVAGLANAKPGHPSNPPASASCASLKKFACQDAAGCLYSRHSLPRCQSSAGGASPASAAAPPAVLAQPDGDDEVAAGTRSCEELINEDSLPFRFASAMGVYGTCAAAKLRGRFGCRVSNISFVDAEAQCSAVGARLCTFDEINKNAARGLGCHGLYDSDSYCWVSDDASGCGPGEVLATRCRHYNAGQHQSDPAAGHTVCKKRDDVVNDAGSLVCCASGTAGEAEFRAGSKVDCSAIKCGADCTGKCGWSEPHQECRNGGKTAPREMLDGECDHVDRSTLDMMPVCKKHVCGKECAAQAGCGWSSGQMGCRPGKETGAHEMAMCAGDENRAVDCSQYACGWDCAQADGCGWSAKRNECRQRQTTTEKEYGLGVCSTASLEAAGIDTCFQHVCGAGCSASPGCGWSTSHGKCMAGKSTGKDEMRAGECPEQPTTTPSPKEFCRQFDCGMRCATAAPICGWSSGGGGKCVPGAKTKASEMGEGNCSDEERAAISADGQDVCAAYHCGQACHDSCIELGTCENPDAACGWSSERGKCIAGARTHTTEMGLCTSTSTSTVTTTTTTTATTATTITVTTTTTATTTTGTTTIATTAIATTTCVDRMLVSGDVWTDNEGEGCAAYATKNYCFNGDYATGWGDGTDTFETYTSGGFHAGQICCICGGGVAPAGGVDRGAAAQNAGTTPCPFTSERELDYFDLVKATTVIDQVVQPNTQIGEMLEKIKNHYTCARLCKKNDECTGFEFKRNQRFCRLFKQGTDYTDTGTKQDNIWSLYKRHTFC